MLNIHKFQCGYELFTTLCIVGDSDIAGIYEYLTLSRGSYCKTESIVNVLNGNWEYETGLFSVVISRSFGQKNSNVQTGFHVFLKSC